MKSLADILAAIEAGPAGPQVAAFFDFDGTLIDGYSAASYFADRARRGEMDKTEAADVVRLSMHGDMGEDAYAAALLRSLAPWVGRPEKELADLWLRLFRQSFGSRLQPATWALVKAHQRRGHTVAIASSAMIYQIAPLAEELEIADVLCTRPAVRDGRLTGEIERPTPWGSGKAAVVRSFAAARGLDLARCHGYANGDEDVDFLRAVGHPTAVNPGRRLSDIAVRVNWPVLHLPRRRTSTLAKLRSVAAYGLLAMAGLGGSAFGAVTGQRRRAAEQACALGSDAILAVSGIRLAVEGRERLWSHRPCVFMFNHQSLLDAFIMLKLMRRDFIGVAKKEAGRMPLLGRLVREMEFVLLDRADRRASIEALQPAVDRVRSGLCLGIAPEGTRSLTSRLGPFKKGGFHVALQAGVPIVPVVMCNTWQVMPRDSVIFRPGTVRVRVLPPIDTTGWHVDRLDAHVADVRVRFQQALEEDRVRNPP